MQSDEANLVALSDEFPLHNQGAAGNDSGIGDIFNNDNEIS